MYKCSDCGRVLDDDELVTRKDYVSDYAGGTYEYRETCPCGGDVEEVYACEGCDDCYEEDELHEGFCENCLVQCATLDNAIESGAGEKDAVHINGFLTYLFSREQIEDILIKEIHAREAAGEGMEISEKARDYCLDDIDWFSGWLQKKCKI